MIKKKQVIYKFKNILNAWSLFSLNITGVKCTLNLHKISTFNIIQITCHLGVVFDIKWLFLGGGAYRDMQALLNV